MTEKNLAEIIYKHVTSGYYLDATGRLSARVRSEQAAEEIATVLRRQQEQPQRARTVKVQPRPA